MNKVLIILFFLSSAHLLAQLDVNDYIFNVKKSSVKYESFDTVRLDTSYGNYGFKDLTGTLRGVYLWQNNLGFWNSQPDTVVFNNEYIVFINPFPKVVLTISENHQVNMESPSPNGISGFIISINEKEGLIEKIVCQCEDGPLRLTILNGEVVWHEWLEDFPSKKSKTK